MLAIGCARPPAPPPVDAAPGLEGCEDGDGDGARDWFRGSDGAERSLLLRSVDLYRREREGWNQCGSNICPVPV